MEVVGFPVATVLHGRLAMRDGELIGTPTGRVVAFEETLGSG
jgi:dihydroorotase